MLQTGRDRHGNSRDVCLLCYTCPCLPPKPPLLLLQTPACTSPCHTHPGIGLTLRFLFHLGSLPFSSPLHSITAAEHICNWPVVPASRAGLAAGRAVCREVTVSRSRGAVGAPRLSQTAQ